jgi:hypothetical protein
VNGGTAGKIDLSSLKQNCSKSGASAKLKDKLRPMKKSAEKMLTIREAAVIAGVADITLRRYAKAGKLPGAQLEKGPWAIRWMIPESALASFEKRGPGKPRKPLSELKRKPPRNPRNK